MNLLTILNSLKLPAIITRGHQKVLKKYLMQTHQRLYPYQSHYKPPQQTLSFLYLTKKYWSTVRWLPIGFLTLSATAMILRTIFFYQEPIAPEVEAHEVINRVNNNLHALSNEEKFRLETELRCDLDSAVDEARNADTLKIMNEEQIAQAAGLINHEGMILPGGLYILSYINLKGQQVLIGVNHNYMPVFKYIKVNNHYETEYNFEKHPFPNNNQPTPFDQKNNDAKEEKQNRNQEKISRENNTSQQKKSKKANLLTLKITYQSFVNKFSYNSI